MSDAQGAQSRMLRSSPLLRVLGAQGLSSLGSSITTVALAVMVFDLTGSVLHMGGILAAATLPLVIMTFFGGALLDRFEGRRLMVVSDIARAALMLLMPVAATRSVGLVYAMAAAVGVFSSVFNPSQVKVVGELVPKGRLVKANSYLSVAGEGAQMGGYLVGGALVAGVGYNTTFVLDAVSYLLSALLLLGLPAAANTAAGGNLLQLVKGSPGVVRTIWATLSLRTNLMLALGPMLLVMMSTPNAYGLALDVFDRGPRGFAIMEALTAAGWIAGGIVASRLDYKGDRNGYVAVSIALMGVCFVGVGFSGSFWLSVVLLSAVAVANVGVIVGSMTLFQELPARPDKGRIIAVRAGFGQIASTIGLLVGGALGERFGEQALFVGVGIAVFVSCAAVFIPYRIRIHRGTQEGALQLEEVT